MRYFLVLFFGILIIGCGGPEPRKPIKVKSSTFFGGDIERSKKLLATEEKMIQDIITEDSLHLYEKTGSGSWFYYERTNEDSDVFPETDDLVTITYTIMSLDNDTIYSSDDIGIVTYKVDKQELFQGLRDAVKTLKENERATFLIPSSLAFGYQGDKNKIGVNIPIKSTLTVLKIEKHQVGIQ